MNTRGDTTRRLPTPGALAAIGLLLVAGLALAGCAAAPPPRLPALLAAEERTPVVLLPGITGSRLRERATHRTVWGSFRAVLLPRDGGYSLARPLRPDSPRRGALEAHEPVWDIRALLGLIDVDFYARLAHLMEAHGYRTGDPDDPAPGENFFVHPYDWRQGTVAAARELLRRLEALRASRGEERLRVHLICQSDASQVARYLLKYGGASLDEAEAGAAAPPPGIEVGKLILVGSAAGGALGSLEDLDRGRRFLAGVGRRFLPEVLFTFPSLYQALPAYRDDLFFDEDGESVDADPFDAADWERYGWSIFSPESARRVARAGRPDLFGSVAERRRFLRATLDRARRLHRLLGRDVPGFSAAEIHVLGNGYLATPERALLVREDGRWRTYFSGDERVRSDPYLATLASAPGDGHATLTSQSWLSPQERAVLAREPVSVPVYHSRIILDPGAQRWILELLLEAGVGTEASRPARGPLAHSSWKWTLTR